jgi:hypothetical protein
MQYVSRNGIREVELRYALNMLCYGVCYDPVGRDIVVQRVWGTRDRGSRRHLTPLVPPLRHLAFTRLYRSSNRLLWTIITLQTPVYTTTKPARNSLLSYHPLKPTVLDSLSSF